MAQTTLESRGSLSKRKILVVDDVMLNRRLLGKLVESLGYDPLYSSDGAEAIDQYQQLRTEDDLFCILMDVQMPRVDGLEATREIRSLEAAAAAAAEQERPTCSDDSACSAASCAEGLADEEPPTPCSRRVPIVGVSACTNADQLKSAALTGLSIDTATERPWEVVGMDLFLAKPIGLAKLAAALETIREARAWSAFERGAAQRASQPLRQSCMPPGGGGSLGTAGSGGSSSCGSFTSLSAGLDIQVRSRPGGQQVAKRSLGGCMQMGALLGGSSSSDEEPAAKRSRVSRLGQPTEPAAEDSPAACKVPAA